MSYSDDYKDTKEAEWLRRFAPHGPDGFERLLVRGKVTTVQFRFTYAQLQEANAKLAKYDELKRALKEATR